MGQSDVPLRKPRRMGLMQASAADGLAEATSAYVLRDNRM